MNLNQYQSEATKFAKYTTAGYPFAALGEEAGEVLGKIAKFSRKHGVGLDTAVVHARELNDVLKADLMKELGDVLWQVQACCVELDVSLEDVAEMNLAKLQGRLERDTIVGEGDTR